MIHLTTPISDDDINLLSVGDKITISGIREPGIAIKRERKREQELVQGTRAFDNARDSGCGQRLLSVVRSLLTEKSGQRLLTVVRSLLTEKRD